MSLLTFSQKVKTYLKTAGYTQKSLAYALSIEATVLNHKLNGTGRTILTHPEVKAITKVLASLEAISTRQEVLDLLGEMNCPSFSQAEWANPPLNKLEIESSAGYVNHPEQPSKQVDSRKVNANLPVQPTSFIGREQEILQIKKLLGINPLVTLTGPGGAGKTRLAIQVGYKLIKEYKQGVWLAELASISDPALIPQTVATVLNIREEPGKNLLTTLAERLRSRQLLLILDNCEHLIEGCARLVDHLLRNCPTLKVLATSRENLNITGETILLVPSMSLPLLVPPQSGGVGEEKMSTELLSRLKDYEATQLFIQRAKTAKPGFEATSLNGTAIAKICSELDGMPLAIELAAAKTRLMPVELINQRLSDRFRLLTGGSRVAQPRQQTLRASIEWSFDLLDEREKKVFCRCGVFSGGWTLEAAEAVCAEPDLLPEDLADLTFQLFNKSLLVSLVEGVEARTTRLNMLETLRQFALEKLEESDFKETVFLNHCRYYLNFLEEIQPLEEMEKEVREAWLNEVRPNLDNLRSALNRTIKTNQLEMTFRLIKGLTPFWDWEGYITEAISYTQAVITKMEESLEEGHSIQGLTGQLDFDRQEALFFLRGNLGDWLRLTGHHQEALEQYHQVLTSVSNSKENALKEGRIKRKAAGTWVSLREYETALATYSKAEEALDTLPDALNLFRWQEWLNIQFEKINLYYERNNLLEIEEILSSIQNVLDQFGSSRQREVNFPNAMLHYLYRQNRYKVLEVNLGYCRTILNRMQETGKIQEIADAHFTYGFSLLWHQDYDEAIQEILDSLEVAERIDDITLKARCLTYLSIAFRRKNKIEQTQFYVNQIEETLTVLKMNEYAGVSKANQGWVYWRQGLIEEAVRDLKKSLAFWSTREGVSTPAYPFRWLAIWPLIAISLAQNNPKQALEYSRELMGRGQQVIPEDLNLLLEESRFQSEQGNSDETSRLLNEALQKAKAREYL